MRIIHQVGQKIWTGRKWLSIGALVLVIVYVLLSAAIFMAMKQTPLRFATIMSELPEVSMMVLPFEPLWNVARAGTLKIGELAPDFRLKSYEKSSWVQLSSFRGDRPVVLIFGSYT